MLQRCEHAALTTGCGADGGCCGRCRSAALLCCAVLNVRAVAGSDEACTVCGGARPCRVPAPEAAGGLHALDRLLHRCTPLIHALDRIACFPRSPQSPSARRQSSQAKNQQGRGQVRPAGAGCGGGSDLCPSLCGAGRRMGLGGCKEGSRLLENGVVCAHGVSRLAPRCASGDA